MIEQKKNEIKNIIDWHIKNFADNIENRLTSEKDNPDGTLNRKLNNAFISALDEDDFAFYSAMCRSFDSSFGNVLESIANDIAKLSFKTMKEIDSFILPEQENKISSIINYYTTDLEHRISPKVEHYNSFTCIIPDNIESYKRKHITDHCIYNEKKDEYYIIELKAGGDLDVKKAPQEKTELLKEFFLLKNLLYSAKKKSSVKLYFAAAYNKNGEGNEWKQFSVKNCFSNDELLIGKDFWNFICDDQDGYDIVIEQYKKSSKYIKQALKNIKIAYLPEIHSSVVDNSSVDDEVLDFVDSLDELMYVLKHSGYSEQSAINLLSQYLQENNLNNDIDKNLADIYKEFKDSHTN